MNVKKVSYVVPVALDEDGTPLSHGERMVEVEPGHWKSAALIQIEEFLSESAGSINV